MCFHRILRVALLCLTAWMAGPLMKADGASEPVADRPNIVFILADDLSGRDLGIYGSANHQTPHLDRLAREGMRFTQAYAPAPICSASRSAFLTGRSSARLHFEFVTKLPGTEVAGNRILQIPSYPLDLPLSETTLGEMLGGAGYRTGFYGKWHVSAHNGGYLNWSTTHGPLQQGFEEGEQEFGSHPYGDAERASTDLVALPEGDFGDDALTEKAVRFLRRHRDESFFLYLSHYYVHDPIRSRAEWSKIRNQRELPPGTDPDRATYAAMVENLDDLVGRVLRELDELGLTENTLVVFTSDNGGHPRYAANGPSRGSKWNLYEGGLRVPFMVRWPGHVAAGTECSVPIIGTDLFPTFAAVANVPLDPGRPLDGMNVRRIWETGHPPGDRPLPLVWHFPFYHPEKGFDEASPAIGVNDFEVSQTRPHSAIRMGDFKLLHFYEDNRDELYFLATDPGERHDLSRHKPDQTRALRRALFAYLRQVDARFPTRN